MSKPKIFSVKDLLISANFSIPIYQRPYKWNRKNILDLVDDVIDNYNEKRSAYRLGTIVLHDNKSKKTDIVDGQQRIITLMLLVKAFIQEEKMLKNSTLKKLLQKLKQKVDDFLRSQSIVSESSKKNIFDNYRIAEQLLGTQYICENAVLFLLKKCQVVVLTLPQIDECFQYFDSQNSRGVTLTPQDLLKAYHLRVFDNTNEQLKKKCVTEWEKISKNKLITIFDKYLYKIRRWILGYPAKKFTKADIDMFKGFRIVNESKYGFINARQIIHDNVGARNSYPFQLDEKIISGRRFFEMINHYSKLIDDCEGIENKEEVTDDVKKIIAKINSYPQRNRIGDRHVREIFNCAILLYVDKFGYDDNINTAIKVIFLWAYSHRKERKSVSQISINKYVLQNNIFKFISEALTPQEFFSTQNDEQSELILKSKNSVDQLIENLDGEKND